ncbi:polyphosphate kinase [Sphingomonas parva]|uniref:Polyphosphate kinase n=1 Tax=Sphingomonas parva TaxID=2555898 RepID=A0A4Y8ZVX5_9SPHN|nr:polyphosphate kinase [Sphingomonas parva]TFI60178.1 polyphosphate kinase [Sphingomonas parva]
MPIDLADYEKGAKYKGDYDKDLEALQERLGRILVAHVVHGKRSLIVCEGWDAAGKGGAIQRITAGWDPRAFQVWPISAPTGEERARHFLWRFWKKLPAAGTIAIFDRSWYGRVLVERVERLTPEHEWRRGYDEINEFEAQQHFDGAAIVKLFFHVTQETQDQRLKARLEHSWKRWKVTADDFRNRARRADYLDAYREMFARTDTRWAPWIAIDGNNKKAARIAALAAVADALEAAVPMSPPEADPKVEALAREAFGKDG